MDDKQRENVRELHSRFMKAIDSRGGWDAYWFCSYYHIAKPLGSCEESDFKTQYSRYKRKGRDLWFEDLVSDELFKMGGYNLFPKIDAEILAGDFIRVKGDLYKGFNHDVNNWGPILKPKIIYVPLDRERYPFEGLCRHKRADRFSDDPEFMDDVREVEQSLGINRV